MGLVLGDAWFSLFSFSGTIIHAELTNNHLLCDRDVFRAANAIDWMQLMELRREHTLDSPILCPGKDRPPVLQSPSGPVHAEQHRSSYLVGSTCHEGLWQRTAGSEPALHRDLALHGHQIDSRQSHLIGNEGASRKVCGSI